MKERRIEKITGIIFVIFLVLLSFLIVRKIVIKAEPMTEYKLLFRNSAGLNIHDPVFLNGFKIGEVEKVEIYNNQALVTISAKKNAPISRDSSISIEFYGLTGSLQIAIKNPLDSNDFYPGDYTGYIQGQELKPFESYTKQLEDFADTMYNFSAYMLKISSGFSKLKRFNLYPFKKSVIDLNTRLSDADINFSVLSISKDTFPNFSRNIENFNTNITSIRTNIQGSDFTSEDYRGFEIIGKSKFLQPDSELYRDFNELKINYQEITKTREKELSWEMHTLYNEDHGYIQDFKIRTEAEKRFNYEVGFNYNQFNSEDVEIDLTVGRNYRNLILKGGIINSTAGLGLECNLLPVKLKGSVFNLSDDSGPFYKGGFDLVFLKNFELSFYYLKAESDLLYGGLGLYFDNDDLDRIFSVLSIMKTGD
ncbi:MAG: MlaD family protein [bacterium]|nr:MlaD family protein [bacterium]